MAQTLSSTSGTIQSAISDFASGLPDRDLFAVLGAVLLGVLALVVVVFLLRAVLGVSRRINQASSERAMADDTTPGNKIMLLPFSGAKSGATRKAVSSALEQYLPEFNFGSAFYLGYSPARIETIEFALTLKDFSELNRILAASNADLLVWGAANGSGESQTLCFTTRELLGTKSPKAFFSVEIAGSPSDWGEDQLRAIAYVAGRRLRPSIGRPADFRADRLAPMVSSMEKIFEAEGVLSGQAKAELESDYMAGALHIGEKMADADWLQKAIVLFTETLERVTPADDKQRWARTKIDLGRAMCLQCEQKYEPARLQEATTHIREGIEALQADQVPEAVKAGAEAIKRAEELVAQRRRFSFRWSV